MKRIYWYIPRLFLYFFIAINLSFVFIHSSALSEPIPSEAFPAAQKALNFILSHESDKFYQGIGFSENDTISDARLGEPFFMYTITAGSLDKYQSDDPVESLISNTGELYFPVTLNGEYKCILFMHWQNNSWELIGYGGVRTAKHLSNLRKAWPSTKGDHPKIITVYQPRARLFYIPEKDLKNLTDLYKADDEEMLPELQNAIDIVEKMKRSMIQIEQQ